MSDTWLICAEGDLKLEGLGPQAKLTVACAMSEIMVAAMKRAARGSLSFTKGQFANVARHLAYLATGCKVSSIVQATKPSRIVTSRSQLNDLKLLLENHALEPNVLEPAVLGILESLGVRASFPASVLQPQAVALQRIRAGHTSMHADPASSPTDENDVENAAENEVENTPAPKKKVAHGLEGWDGSKLEKELKSYEWRDSDDFEDELRSSEDKLKRKLKLNSLYKSVKKSQAQLEVLAGCVQSEFGEVKKVLRFNTEQPMPPCTYPCTCRLPRIACHLVTVGERVLVSCAYFQVKDIYENLPAKRKASFDNLM